MWSGRRSASRGRKAVCKKEAQADIRKYIDDRQIVFITAGMGGGTGTGSAPYIAEMAKRSGSLVMGIVTVTLQI